MSVFYPKQLEYLSSVSASISESKVQLEDAEGIYGIKILVMDLTQDAPIGHITKDDGGHFLVELDDDLL